jgi:hypothetical protein
MPIFAWALGLELRFWVIEDSPHYNYSRFEQPIPFFLTTDHNEHTETDPRSFMSYFRVFRVFRGSMAFGSYTIQRR